MRNDFVYYLTFTTFMNYGFGSVPENFVDFSCLESSNAFGTFQKVADAKKSVCGAQSSLTESSSKCLGDIQQLSRPNCTQLLVFTPHPPQVDKN